MAEPRFAGGNRILDCGPEADPRDFSPVRYCGGQYETYDPDQGWQTIFDFDHPLHRLVHGWQPVGLYRRFGCVLLLELRHGSGAEATWYLDASRRRLGDVYERLPEAARVAIETVAVPALERLRDGLLVGNPGEAALDPLCLRVLNVATILKLMSLAGEEFMPPQVAVELAALPASQEEIVVGGARLSVPALHACVAPVIQEQHMAVLRGGDYEAVCPLTGNALRTRATLVDMPRSFCRFESPVQDGVLVSYLYNRTGIAHRELFIPALNCTVALRAPEQSGLFSRLLALMVRAADLLPGYLAGDKMPADILYPYPGLHLGHVLWNDLTGLDRVRRDLPPASLPLVIAPNAELGTEVYGPTDAIFPEFADKVWRIPADAVARSVYRNGLVAMQVYDRWVSRELAGRIVRVARADAASQADHVLADQFSAEGRMVIVIGLRVQNRTVADPVGLFREVIEHLSHRLGPLAIVLDGINARVDGDASTDYGMISPQTGRAPVLDELEIVIGLRRHFRDEAAVRIVNAVGAPVARSVFWADRASFFVAFWGAGLAKYRWIANKPGLALTNRHNLDHPDGDLGIYHKEDCMEAPTGLDFMPAGQVSDVASERANMADFYSNFRVDMPGLLAALDRLIERIGGQRPEPAD